MKYINKIVLICFSLMSVSVFGQTDDERNIDKNFDRFWYKRAAEQYESAVKKGDTSQETLQRLGDAYYFNSDMENAAKWYGKLFSKYENKLEPVYAFRYIQSLEGTGNYHLAKGLMKIYSEKLNDPVFQVDQLTNNDKKIDILRNAQPQFYITPLTINTKFSDFGAVRYLSRVVFASTRDSSVFTTRKYHWNEQPFLNLFIADTTLSGGDLKNVKTFSKSINTKYHEASVAFTQGFDTIYFTRNNYTKKRLKRDEQGINNLTIYRAVLDNDQWKNEKEIPFSSDEYSIGHPALSPDGKKLYFVSDMPGTIGGSDIYVVDILPEGNFSKPKNLGPTINTSGREVFPFVSDKKLYFASDGHLGYGGLDVFEATITDDEYSKPRNLGLPLNSKSDDFAYMVDEDTQRGYVSSNRPGGVGDDDIYSFQRSPCRQTLQGTVVNSDSGHMEPNVRVELLDSGKVVHSTLTNSVGEYLFEMPVNCGYSYTITARKAGFDGAQKKITTSSQPNYVNKVPLEINHLLIVKEGDELKIKIGLIYFDFDKWEITKRAKQSLDTIVSLMKEYPRMVIKIESHTDSRGNDAYNMKLSDRRAKSTRGYIISKGIAADRIESAMGYGESRLLNNCSNSIICDEAEHNVNRRSEFIIMKMK